MFRRWPRRFRFLLLWWIALALPVQGIAAVTMLHCDHTNASHAAHHAPAMTVMPVMEAGAPLHDHHDHHDDHTAHGHGAEKSASADKASCSACAACCLGAGLTAPPVVLPVPLAAVSVSHAANEPAWAGPILALPERPPRPHFA